MARKSRPATANALQPAIASARGERLGGCGLCRSTAAPARMTVLPLEGLRGGSHEGAAPQRVLLDLEAPRPDLEQVEGVRLLARAARARGARLHEQRAHSLNALCGVADAGRMQVSGDEDIHAAIRQPLERHKWMMRDDDLHHVLLQRAELPLDALDLRRADAAALEDERARGVDAEHRDLFVAVAGLEL